AENALRGVAVGRKNWMFAGSDSGGEHAAVLYSLIGSCPEKNPRCACKSAHLHHHGSPAAYR
ncbi:IS66 family transposase, partial [Escherichia coli]|uniref:IS66 family transposase n=1 Tax=Escherichia coli TaxID=562 RepID=UPI00113230F2